MSRLTNSDPAVVSRTHEKVIRMNMRTMRLQRPDRRNVKDCRSGSVMSLAEYPLWTETILPIVDGSTGSPEKDEGSSTYVDEPSLSYLFRSTSLPVE